MGDTQTTDPTGPPLSQSDDGATPKITPPSAPNVNEKKPVSLSSYPTAAYENKSTVHASATLAIDVLRRSSDASTPLKSAAERLAAVLKYYHQPMANRKTIESLIPRVADLAESLVPPAREADVKEIRRRQVLKRKLIKPLRNLGPLEERGEKDGFLDKVQDAVTLTDLTDDINDAVTDYQAALQQDINDMTIKLTTEAEAKESDLNSMNYARDAGYRHGDRKGCLKGTRKDVVLRIERWLMDEEEKRIFWLNGPAGTGKSTITQTFAEISFVYGKLGASFFCSRGFEDRCDLQVICPTLAFQLAHQYPPFREQLLQVLSANPEVGREPFCSQFEKTIVHPLKAAQVSTLIIIDALDECKDKEPVSTLLSALSRYVHEIPEVMFFITARPENPIREGFKLEPLHPLTVVFKLHDVPRHSVDADITLFLRTHLTDIPKRITHDKFPEDWPTSHDVDVLCKRAAGLFIYASATINFIASKIHNPTKRLDRIILRPRDALHERGIDILYTQILELAFHNVDSGEQQIYSDFKCVVGTALIVFHPLSRKALSDLIGTRATPSRISTALCPLHSLLDVPDSEDGPIRPFHESFAGYLTDQTRCEDERFFVDPSVHHKDILFSCLDLMKARMKKNICDLDDRAVLSEVENLSARTETCIGSSLEYACMFWARHLAEVPVKGPHVKRIQEAIDEFFTKRLLCWIEVLSTVGHLGAAVYAIDDIRQWYTSAGISTSKQVDDIEHLILEHFDGIHDSPSHVYHSALPLSPSSSWFRECYGADLAQEVGVLMGLPDRWDTCSRTIPVEGEPSAFAHWENVIGVGLGSSSVVLLDSITGSRQLSLSGHVDTILSLAFSSDGTLLASGSEDKTVKLWDVQTGGVVRTFSDHTSAVLAVSVSPDRATIASGTEDGTVRLWEVRTGRCRPTVLCHDSRVTAISFSPIDSRRLISSSWDRTVRQWDVDDGQIGTPCHEAGRVAHVAYAPDGTRFVSCGGTVATVRDSESRAEVVRLQIDATTQPSLLRCCRFSPDGRLVACAAASSIHVWDITGPEARLVGKFVGHSRPIISIAFSSFLISVSLDRSVKVWQSSNLLTDSITTGNNPAPHGSTPIESIYLFAEEGIVVTSDLFGVVKIRDLTTGSCGPPFSAPAKGIQDIHMAGDTLMVVWWVDREYRVWDVGNGQPLRTVRSSLVEISDLRISEDGSKIFGLGGDRIEALSLETGESAGHVELQDVEKRGELVVHGFKVWLTGSGDVGWDFGGREVSCFSLSEGFPDRPRLDLVDPSINHIAKPAWIKDTVTGRPVFYIPERYMKPGTRRRLDGRYLLVWSRSGEVVVIDLNPVLGEGS